MLKRREMAIKRRRRFIITVVLIFILVVGIIISVISCNDNEGKKEENTISSSNSVKAESESKTESSTEPKDSSSNPEAIVDTEPENTVNEKGLDISYGNMMLVNGDNPLPDNYDSDVREYLKEIDPDLRNNNYVTKIHKSVYPYISEMVKAAQADGVDLKVWSPFRSYADQEALFNRQVERSGGDEAKAATVVARPGTSEHNTGICADFNMADDAFEETPMYKWMCEHAEDYGFILRYPKDKQDKTGVIYESWHWRFVGIENAKKINKSGLCLEEYIDKYGSKQEITSCNF